MSNTWIGALNSFVRSKVLSFMYTLTSPDRDMLFVSRPLMFNSTLSLVKPGPLVDDAFAQWTLSQCTDSKPCALARIRGSCVLIPATHCERLCFIHCTSSRSRKSSWACSPRDSGQPDPSSSRAPSSRWDRDSIPSFLVHAIHVLGSQFRRCCCLRHHWHYLSAGYANQCLSRIGLHNHSNSLKTHYSIWSRPCCSRNSRSDLGHYTQLWSHSDTANTTMALHDDQCRAMLLETISHAQRFTSMAETRDCEEFRCSCNSIKLRACIDDSFMNVNSMSQTNLFVEQLVLNCRRSFRVFAVRVISAFPVNSSEVRTTSDSAALVSNLSLANSPWITWGKLMTLICS